MRRVLAYCWSADASTWVGRRVELYFDPEVTFGKEKPGGTRIKALSHIDGPRRIPLLVTRGRSATFTVQPLKDEPTVTVTEIEGQVMYSPEHYAEVQEMQAVVAKTLGAEVIEPMTKVQSVHLGDAFTAAGITDKSDRLAYASEVVGRTLATSAELTKAEASDVIDALKREAKG
jgi:hypothetical protein